MNETLILRGIHPSKIDDLVGYYQWFPKLTVKKHNRMISEILDKRKRNKLPDFIKFIEELKIISYRFAAKADKQYSPRLLYRVCLWYLYHRFVNRFDYLDPKKYYSIGDFDNVPDEEGKFHGFL